MPAFLTPGGGGSDYWAWYDEYGNRYLIFTDAHWHILNGRLAREWLMGHRG